MEKDIGCMENFELANERITYGNYYDCRYPEVGTSAQRGVKARS